MTREVTIGEQVVKLRATARLPIAYRALFNRDLLRDMDAWREKFKATLEERESAETSDDTPEVSVDVAEASADAPEVSVDAEEASADAPEVFVDAEKASTNAPEVSDNAAEASVDAVSVIRVLDLDLMARLAYTMAKSAEPSIPNDVGEWLDTIDDPNGLYSLAGAALALYNNAFETTVDAKKNIPPQLEK